MNEALIKLYGQQLDGIVAKLTSYNTHAKKNEIATNPFLISIPEKYQNVRNKIMIFGQETNCWYWEKGKGHAFSNNLRKSLELYKSFYLKRDFYKKKSPFWNEFKRIKYEISKTHDAVFIWNNINKIGRTGTGNVSQINTIQFQYFQVIREEINLLKPDIMVFLTGPNYDNFIRKNIGEFRQETIGDSLYEMHFKHEMEGVRSFKTYHPNALYRQGKNKMVIPDLIRNIRNACI